MYRVSQYAAREHSSYLTGVREKREKWCQREKGEKDMSGDIVGGAAGGRSGERATGTPNSIYDLSSVLYHALEGGASYDQYIRDAEQEGDQELADFFSRVRDEDSVRADDAWLLLARRTSTYPPTEGAPEVTSLSTADVPRPLEPGAPPLGPG
jgi:hypothetical protein